MIKLLKRAVFFGIFFLSFTALAAEFPAVPNPFRYVNDYTNTLTANQRDALETKLTNYGNETSSQIAVVIIPTTDGTDISSYTFELGRKWGVGRAKLNNGVLMVVAKNDRKVFITTGQGLQGVLTDAFTSQVIRNVIIPAFKQNQYAQGIDTALDQIIAVSKGEFDPLQQEEEYPYEKYIPFLMVLAFVLFVLFGEVQWRKDDVYVSPTNNHNQLNQAMLEAMLRSRRRGNSAGFGSGLGGGFGSGGRSGGHSSGGFGGGDFDGGGAGGSW